MICLKCGKESDGSLSFCPYCGHSQPTYKRTLPPKKRKFLGGNIMTAMASIGILIAIVAIFSLLGPKNTSPHLVTLTEYHSIQEGMAYDEVKQLFKSAGTVVEQVADGEYRFVTVQWLGEVDGSTVSVRFQNGYSIATVQIGLE